MPTRTAVHRVDADPQSNGLSTAVTPATPDAEPVHGHRALIDVRSASLCFGPSAERGRSREQGKFVTLDNVSLTIPAGEFISLVGASGCGKTSLLNMIAGVLQPTSGAVLVNGRPAQSPNLDIGYMFARDALFPWRTALRNVQVALEGRGGFSRSDRRERAREMLALVGLDRFEDRFPSQLSQGMRQRVALARTLAPDPSLLLMDEPFAALDARTKLHLEAEFLSIWERNSGSSTTKTVVFVTHDLQEATLLADRVVVMVPGPGRIARDDVVALPRPRAAELGEVMFTDEFRNQHHELFKCLEGAMSRTNGPMGDGGGA